MVSIKGPNAYLGRIPGNNCRYVHADHFIADDFREQTPKPLERDYLPEGELRQDIPSIRLPVSLEPPEELVNPIPEAGD